MCLDEIIDSPSVKEGYKVFKKIKGEKVIGEYHGTHKMNIWLTNISFFDKFLHIKPIIYGNSFHYEAGFHVFHNLDDARRYSNYWELPIIKKVLVEDPICVGLYSNKMVTVARRIKILSGNI